MLYLHATTGEESDRMGQYVRERLLQSVELCLELFNDNHDKFIWRCVLGNALNVGKPDNFNLVAGICLINDKCPAKNTSR